MVRQARRENLSPDDFEFYNAKRPSKYRPHTYAHIYSSYHMSDREMFTLKKYGKPFFYYNVFFRRYGMPALKKLFNTSHTRIHAMINRGLLPEPFMIVERTNGMKERFWLYHQVFPVYQWYLALRHRGLAAYIPRNMERVDILVLKHRLHVAQRAFERKLSVDKVDKYTEIAGKYGVIPIAG